MLRLRFQSAPKHHSHHSKLFWIVRLLYLTDIQIFNFPLLFEGGVAKAIKLELKKLMSSCLAGVVGLLIGLR